MLNVLGQHVEAAERYVTENPSAHLHMYGKLEAKHNRKMGHVTLFSDEPDNVVEFGKGIDFLGENSNPRTRSHGTTYAYAFQKAGHQVEHVLRDSKKNNAPKSLSVDLLDGRYHSKGENKHDTYEVHVAEADSEYDFIFLSVRHGFVKEAVETLRKKIISKAPLFSSVISGILEKRSKSGQGDYDYILAFPTAGGHMQEDHLDGVLFDHLMLEGEQKAHISNYADLTTLLTSADLKWEVPHDMVEWIWIHMAINAGVTSTAARSGNLENPEELALNLMNSSSELSLAIKAIREALKVVEARGVNLKLYKAELLPYKIPAWIAGKAMKVMFAKNELTRKIMTLHNDKQDIFYCCQSVYQTGQELGVEMPILGSKYEGNFDLGGFMIQLIVNAFVEKDKTEAVVEVLYASSNHEKVRAKYEELVAQYPENYLAIYDLPMDTDLNTLDHYPSVWIGKGGG